MKAFAATVLTCMMLCGSISALPVHAAGGVSVGVKRGDWAEYSVDITGNPPPIHNVTWMRMEVLQVNGDAFPVNLTVRYRNGNPVQQHLAV